MMAAIAAAGRGHEVLLLEKNEKLGKKLFITGKGRCNVTNACEVEELFGNVVRNAKFLYSAFYTFDNGAVQDFFRSRGCPLKVERGNRIFPESDHSSDIIRTLSKELEKAGVRVRLHTPVKRLLTETSDAGRRIRGVILGGGEEVASDAVVLACGGLSYPATGSCGDGYALARREGHSLVPCQPGLVPFTIREEWCGRLSGLALKNVSAVLYMEGKEIHRGFGEMLFTHFGVSGPLILSVSSYYQEALCRYRKKKKTEEEPEVLLKLDLKPALTEEQMDKRLLRDFDSNKNRQFANALGKLFPASLIPVMVELSGIDPAKKVHEITREERRRFAACIKGLPLTVTGTRGFEEAIITRGGISVKEINPSTMESRLVSGLYMAGEMLDLDALTGGFNLQIAWSTGYLAGSSIP